MYIYCTHVQYAVNFGGHEANFHEARCHARADDEAEAMYEADAETHVARL